MHIVTTRIPETYKYIPKCINYHSTIVNLKETTQAGTVTKTKNHKPQPKMRLLILASASASAAVLLLLLQVSAAGATRTEALVGGWEPIKDPSDPYVVEIAEFAIKTHNDESKTSLVLQKVVKGETQVVAGTNYRLVVEAKDGAAGTKTFEAVVWDKPGEHSRSLTSFKPIQGGV